MHPTHPTIDQALIPQTEVCKAIGQTRSGLDKLRKKDPTFPKPIKFSTRCVGWRVSDLDALEERLSAEKQ